MRSFAVATALVLALSACGDDDDDDAADTTTEQTDAPDTSESMTGETTEDTSGEAGSGTIVDVAAATPDLSTLVTAVQTAGLTETLSGEGPFTVFAPTNEAFAAIPADKLDAILADTELLTQILTYHVVSGEYPASAVADLPDVATGAAVPTVEGQDVTIVAGADGVRVNEANVVQPDVEASNGVVHVIDAVLLPPGVTL
ncbi:MAG: hypothetical protein KatS3mg009_0757 [Acidimicrobiia bacterium]|nr:MAG: hypothetical protein KatS3mg009_0757 [Acidimicrobiia bacterium]